MVEQGEALIFTKLPSLNLTVCIIDGRLLRTGSANFSRSGETRQDNDLVALRGASVCAGFDAKFDRARARS
jgi:phosphatidylserine/phosphatidylglycerophosphate/cardiolipin synthase-like enzyme